MNSQNANVSTTRPDYIIISSDSYEEEPEEALKSPNKCPTPLSQSTKAVEKPVSDISMYSNAFKYANKQI
jgi:hypothetical protein